jgi:hypothetical protein
MLAQRKTPQSDCGDSSQQYPRLMDLQKTIMPLDELAEKWRAFNWHVIEVDGHDFRALDQAFLQAKVYLKNRQSLSRIRFLEKV